MFVSPRAVLVQLDEWTAKSAKAPDDTEVIASLALLNKKYTSVYQAVQSGALSQQDYVGAIKRVYTAEVALSKQLKEKGACVSVAAVCV